MKQNKEKIILGLDPGTSIMGYGLIHVIGPKISVLQFGVIHLSKYANHELKLKKIFERVTAILEEFKPDDVALEAPFYGKNIQSMLKLGRAQGVAMAAALNREIPITEYAPKKVKQSVTGNVSTKFQTKTTYHSSSLLDTPLPITGTKRMALNMIQI